MFIYTEGIGFEKKKCFQFEMKNERVMGGKSGDVTMTR